MQFVNNGPEIPDTLLQAHEDGQVVFFCGAGISYPAGLPDFKGLVEQIYRSIGTSPAPVEQEALSREQYDATLDLLERRVPGQRLKVRTALAEILKPNLRRKGATDTHKALLELARDREGAIRLVTTNFDRIFEHVTARSRPKVSAYAAPLLPIPKSSRWNGIVYLHGLLSKHLDESTLNRLVVTSGDFGLAYLTERWAARFVSELFRSFVVCFVGYSINDPVMRYMMDALAADRMLGETTPQAYALGDCHPGQESVKTIEWEAKGVTPILYEVPTGTHDHSALHRTLKAWAEIYRDGVLGTERIVVDHAGSHPTASTRQDNFVGRMLWALSHQSGLPAKRFAEFNPVPPLEWLTAFSEDRYRYSDLPRFGVPPNTSVDDKLQFSLAHRPSPYSNAPWMQLASGGPAESRWDNVMVQIARWLVRHLNDPELIIWFAQRGGQLHEQMAWIIEHELSRFSKLEVDGKSAEINCIRSDAPNAIPRPSMHKLWRLLLSGRIKSHWRNGNLFDWRARYKQEGFTVSSRLELRSLLAPQIAIKKPFVWSDELQDGEDDERLSRLVDWELVLAADDASTFMKEMINAPDSDHDWSEAIGDFQQLLKDALDLAHELGQASEKDDRSFWDLASISPHWQNRGFHDWVVLIELLRDAWLSVRSVNPQRAVKIAEEWFDIPYPTFKRLALFAASQEECIPTTLWVSWLLTDEAWWLWSENTRRESMRLLVLQGHRISPADQELLETTVLAGPPRHMYRPELEPAYWQELVDRSVWLRLAKLQSSGCSLGPAALSRLSAISAANPIWQLATNERDEFSRWMSGTGDPDFEDSRQIDLAPRRRKELVDWLKKQSVSSDPLYEDTWLETCRTRFFHCALALHDLAQEDIWPAQRWETALQAWSMNGQASRSWQCLATAVSTMPDNVLQDISHGISWWLETVSKTISKHEGVFLSLSQRVLMMTSEDEMDMGDPVTSAINHPIGHVAKGLLNLWLSRQPNDNDKLPDDIKPMFTDLCDTNVKRYRNGRVLLAAHLIPLYRVDRDWTESNLIPLFDWAISTEESRASWEGFLWSARLYRPLLIAMKSKILETAGHYSELGNHAHQFATFLTFVALNRPETYAIQEFQSAIGKLPVDGLEEVSEALVQALEGAGEQREAYWNNRIKPFWQEIWPKQLSLTTDGTSESLSKLCIAARGEFPDALATTLDWIRPLEHPHYTVHLFQNSKLARRFPEESLRYLSAIVDNQLWVPRDLLACLQAITEAQPDLSRDPRYQQLLEYVRRNSG